jgi:hypothetical protein
MRNAVQSMDPRDYTGWYCARLIELGLRNSAKPTAAMITKKTVMACMPTHPDPDPLFVEGADNLLKEDFICSWL